MAVLIIRNLPEEVRARLRRRAARAGRSMEAEVRAILTDASVAEERRLSAAALQAWVGRLYRGRRPSGVVDELEGGAPLAGTALRLVERLPVAVHPGREDTLVEEAAAQAQRAMQAAVLVEPVERLRVGLQTPPQAPVT